MLQKMFKINLNIIIYWIQTDWNWFFFSNKCLGWSFYILTYVCMHIDYITFENVKEIYIYIKSLVHLYMLISVYLHVNLSDSIFIAMPTDKFIGINKNYFLYYFSKSIVQINLSSFLALLQIHLPQNKSTANILRIN